MVKFNFGVVILSVLMIALYSFSAFAVTDAGFTPAVEKSQVFGGKITSHSVDSLKAVDNASVNVGGGDEYNKSNVMLSNASGSSGEDKGGFNVTPDNPHNLAGNINKSKLYAEKFRLFQPS